MAHYRTSSYNDSSEDESDGPEVDALEDADMQHLNAVDVAHSRRTVSTM